MAERRRNLKEDNKVRREFFARNLSDLISQVMRLNRLDAAKALGVDYGWLRKACSVGLVRPDNRSLVSLKKIAERFHLTVEDLWTPTLLPQIWAGGYLPDVRRYFIQEFRFDQFVKESKFFREAVEDLMDMKALGPQPGLSEGKFGSPEEEVSLRQQDEANRRTCEELAVLLATGKYESLRHLIHDLCVAEGSKDGGTRGAGGATEEK